MAKLNLGDSKEKPVEELPEESTPEVSTPPISRKHVKRTTAKESAIIVEDITLVITQRGEETPSISFQVTMAPFEDGTVPEVLITTPITLTDNGFRKGIILGCISNEMTTKYPDRYISDPTVVVNNYATEIRKEVDKFDTFKDDVLYTLQYTFQLDTDVE